MQKVVTSVPLVLGKNVRLLQNGNGCQVYEYTSKVDSGKFALKFVDQTKINVLNDLQNEHNILKNLNNPHIIQSFGLEKDFVHNGKKFSYLKLEFAQKQTLFELVKFFGDIKISVCRQIFSETASGIAYLHSINLVHRDVKLENILVKEDYLTKIADFGLSTKTENDLFYDQVGTIYYKSPDLLRAQDSKEKGQEVVPYSGKKADVFALGVVFFAMIFRKFVSGVVVGDEQYKRIRENRWDDVWNEPGYKTRLEELQMEPDSMVEELKDLLQGMLQDDPKKRLTIEEVMSHPWMQGAQIPSHSYFEERISKMPPSSASSGN